MGEAAEDARDQEEREMYRLWDAMQRGITRCPLYDKHEHGSECPVCHDLNWLNIDGQPCDLD